MFRTCLALGIDDPIHWFNCVGAEVVDWWIAYWQLEPFGDQWRQAATIAAEVNFQTAAQTARSTGKMPPIRTIDSYLPVPTDDDGLITGKRALTDDEAHFSLLVGFGFQ